ncbi:WXG100 family type VII secretion target [Micromonospora sp. DT43]|uniref:WXG100 family type VII secretion target n=1 Tax=Micromonospora sp. DT43 TaxID=3393440 RepID=UPI003CF87AC7
MANGDLITYRYDDILEGIDQMNGVNRNVEHLIETLAANVGNALDNWKGPAAASYNNLAAEIERKFADMNTIVAELAKTLGLNAEDMKEQDVRSGNRFGNR